MKIAVAATGKTRDSQIAPCFARAPCFHVVDVATEKSDVRCNAASHRMVHLAGTQAAGILISMGVEAVIVGRMGPKAFATLDAAGVRVFTIPSGTVAEAVNGFETGSLVQLVAADVPLHWNHSAPSHPA